jgi:two-component system copper resistance phosphate regulon response regulator CusR
MLTGRGAEEDVLRGFELGATDYVIKPFHYRELLARIQRHLHQAVNRPSSEEAVLRTGSLEMDPIKYSVGCAGREFHLTPTEFRLLHSLMRRTGRVVPNRVLLREGWDYESQSTEVIRATVHRLRHKLAKDAPGEAIIRTRPGIGLMLEGSPA